MHNELSVLIFIWIKGTFLQVILSYSVNVDLLQARPQCTHTEDIKDFLNRLTVNTCSKLCLPAVSS